MDTESFASAQASAPAVPWRGGLYARVKLSRRGANLLVAVSVLLLVAVTAVSIAHNGFTVTFCSNGGTDVESVRVYYAQDFPFPSPPVRTGYRFAGWFLDADCRTPFDPSASPVTDSTTLYAGWEPLP